jgi:hypothetical protein
MINVIPALHFFSLSKSEEVRVESQEVSVTNCGDHVDTATRCNMSDPYGSSIINECIVAGVALKQEGVEVADRIVEVSDSVDHCWCKIRC